MVADLVAYMDEDAALAELCVLTGLEPSSARHMLAAAGNVELAASLYFDGSPGAVSDASDGEGAIFQIDDLEAPSIEEASVRQAVPQHGRAGRGRRRRGRGSACEWDGQGLVTYAVAVFRHHLVVLGALLPGKRVRADDLLAAQVGPAVQKKVADVGDELGAETLKARVLTVFGVVARGE